MKKIIAVFFLLICGIVVLLATIDLTPYFALNQPDLHEEITVSTGNNTTELPTKTGSSKQITAQSTSSPAQNQPLSQIDDSQQVQQEELSEINTLNPLEDKIIKQQEKTDPALQESADNDAAHLVLNQTSSPLPELEVTILPAGEYPFSILLETFAEVGSAQLAIPYYQKRGIEAHWVKVDLGESGIRYRLFTGEFRTVTEAQQFIDRKKLVDKPIKPTYYAARIGVYQDKAQLANDFSKTRETGVIPYILGTKNGDYHLYVGAFYTFIGAGMQCDELKEAGLSCKPVKRSTVIPE